MIFGKNLKYESIKKDTDIPWKKVKEFVEPNLLVMLESCLKTKFEERIKIRQLPTLEIFSDLCVGKNLPFLSESKFFLGSKHKIAESVVHMSEEDEKNLLAQVKKDISRFKFYQVV